MSLSALPPRHDHQKLLFPQNFLWGAATSAHQVEGNNTLNDWWEWEERIQPPDKRSGLACDEYHLYESDFKLAKKLGHNSHRLSIEWSRIEPKEGQFNQSEIDHYKNELKILKHLGFSVILTLHHFTNPIWFKNLGGWESSHAPELFERFVRKVCPEFAPFVDLWITINEPTVYAFMGYSIGIWPPQKKSNLSLIKVLWNLSRAHKQAYTTIHAHVPKAQVGIAHNVSSFENFHKHSILEALSTIGLDLGNNHLFYLLTGHSSHDFLGLNYYFNRYISQPRGKKIPGIIDINQPGTEVSDLGWEIFPEGIFDILMDLSSLKKPIYITENGLASTNDDRRCRFLISYLKEVYQALELGADVRGYFHWALIDNFEWADGFTPRFGLIEVDYATQKRTPRGSAFVYRDIIAQNGISHNLLRFLGHSIDTEDVLNKNTERRK